MSELLKCIKLLFDNNASFCTQCLNEGLLVENIIEVVLPPPSDSKQVSCSSKAVKQCLRQQAVKQ